MNQPQPEKVVITGLGAVTPLAHDVNTLWQSLLQDGDAISELDRFDTGGIACTRAGLVRNYTPPHTANPPASLAESFALGAATEALRHARLTDTTGTTLIMASNFGALDIAETTLGPDSPPTNAAALAHSSVTTAVAQKLALGGTPITLSLSCASGASAIAYAASAISRGDIDHALVVGFDAISRCAWSGLCALRTMTRDKLRPFDLNRNGTLFAEGAAALLLESTASATRRNATPLARLSGWASGNNGFHMTAPAPRGAGSAHVIRQTLQQAQLPAKAIDHFNAHGTGTKPNDITEFQALEDTLGPEYARAIPVTANKSQLGHMLGAAGAVEAVISIMTLRHQIIPPTTNFQTADPECPVNLITSATPAKIDTILANAAGFGGCNAALLFNRLT